MRCKGLEKEAVGMYDERRGGANREEFRVTGQKMKEDGKRGR